MKQEGMPKDIEIIEPQFFDTSVTYETDDKPQDECGVFGIYAPGEYVAGITYQALLGLQHRGQSGAGIVVPVGENLNGRVILAPTLGLGKVPKALEDQIKPNYAGGASQLDVMTDAPLAIGHTRYSTAEGDDYAAVQPLLGLESNIALAHNGHIDGLETVAALYDIDTSGVVSDSDLLTRIIDHRSAHHGSLEASLSEVLPQVNGAYSLIITDGKRVVAVRDPFGFHPLALGEMPDGGGSVVASESVVFEDIGATFVRDVEPGEVVIIDEQGITSFMIDRLEEKRGCMFEYIYIARPDGTIDNVPVYRARKQLGRFLAEDNPSLKADIVVGVPQSGLAAAAGYAEASGIPQVEGIFKNPYADRTFIERGDKRQTVLNSKFRMNTEELFGKRVILVDDSIIKGKTTARLVAQLRRAGVTEISVLSSAPPYINACLMGMDTHNTELLIARGQTPEEIAKEIDADRVIFNRVERVEEAIRISANRPITQVQVGSFCTACATGEYPFPVGASVDIAMPVARSGIVSIARSGA